MSDDTSHAAAPVPILIDTDAGDDVDDVLAIAFAARWGRVDLRGVTTVGWQPEDRARLVRKVLDAAGAANVPVAAGSARPLSPQTAEVFARYSGPGKLNHCDVVTPEERQRYAPVAEHAVDMIIRMVRGMPGQLTLVCIGQLTNIAAALKKRSDLAGQIKAIALMGGETELLRAEHNIVQDVAAAHDVLASGVPIFMGTWSVTRRFVLMPDDVQRLRAHDSELTRLLCLCIDKWAPHQSWKPGPVMYDLAPILWVGQPALIATKPKCVRVEAAGTYTRGLTMPVSGDPNALVSTDLDLPAISDLYHRTLTGS
ncbi:MAG: nucleoside hydrolase [Phycisphaeraceae bacterium]